MIINKYPLPCLLALSLSACGGSSTESLQTLDGKAPLVVAHRGLPGLYPEETRPAYEAAADAGADSLELDVHMSKDCVLVARHNPWLSDNTNISTVALTIPRSLPANARCQAGWSMSAIRWPPMAGRRNI